tara:strand:- start:1299 stop:2132 length:834 start_codon:yes stop_codon:yes gene_type:complete
MRKILGASLLCLVMSVIGIAVADDTNTQSNTSGSNTNITGGYTTTNNNTYSGSAAGQSTSTTTNTTTNTTTGTDTRVTSMASAPSMSAYSQDLCIVGISGGVSTIGFGISAGSYITDENCERIKLSKVLSDLGMKVASVSILCQDPRVFFAMEQSGTPCPFEGKIGKAASDQWKKYDKLRPDYVQYTDRLRTIEDMEDEKDRKAELADWNAKLKAADKLRNGDVKTEDSIADKEAELIKKKIEELKSEIKKSKKVNVEVTVGDDNEVTIDKKKELKK